MKKLLLLLFLTSGFLSAQNIRFSDSTTISVFTCGPGDELYSQFGHSAFRIQDHITGIDIVYNYGIFDFEDPNFYTNFAKGKLIYKIGYTDISNFYSQYKWENRTVREQILDLSPAQKKALSSFLQNNAKPENAKYQYDFLYNNCATKIPEVLNKSLNNKIRYSYPHLTTEHTFRDLINDYVPHNSWANVGINIALGSVIDIPVQNPEYNFLPDYVFDVLSHSKIANKNIVSKSNTIIKRDENKAKSTNFLLCPYFILTTLSIVILLITYKDFKKDSRTRILDLSITFITGLIGLFICLLWFATNHTATVNNLNILWAFPLNLLVTFSLFKDRKWHHKYFRLTILLMIITAVVWIAQIEAFALGLIPLLMAIAIRYIYLMNYFKKQ